MVPDQSENSNFDLFMATGFVLLAWRLAPGHDGGWALWVTSAFCATVGTILVIAVLRTIRRVRGPRPGPRTPPVWLLLWLVIIGLAWSFGTPHLRWSYSPRACVYLGWNGAEVHGASPCPLIEMLPLRFERTPT